MKFLANETNQKKSRKLPNSVQIQLRYAGFTKHVGVLSRILLTAIIFGFTLRLCIS